MTPISLLDSPAELPTANSTASYWLRDPSKKLLGHRTTQDLPATADVVLVGSGITGAFAARELVAGGRSVVMIEAREACWGATGRNGGHCHPGVWTSTPEVARFELATFNLIKNLVADHDIPCDWHTVGAIHPIFSPDILDSARKRMQTLQEHPDLRDKAILIQDKDELAACRIPAAMAAVYHPNAAKLWPYKLVSWLLERLLDENEKVAGTFNLQTQTQVTKLQRSGQSWIVHTQRGQVSACDVLLATNAYTPYLLPKMTRLIVPMRSQICALEPRSGTAPLQHSYGWFMDSNDKHLTHNFLIQRGPEDRLRKQNRINGAAQPVDTSLIFGVDLAGPNGDEGKWRDDKLNPVMSRMLRERLHHTLRLFRDDGDAPKAEAKELRATYEWTGIMGYSRDGSPWVGRVPATLMSDLVDDGTDSNGLWLCAAYTGHGMPVAARCAIAVAEMMLGKEEGSIQLPLDWMVTEERVKRAREMKMPMTVKDMAQILAAN